MSRFALPIIALAAVVSAGCGTGGLNYWLYPEPHLLDAEEATFIAYESHQLQAIDGEETAIRCWGDPRTQQAYRRNDVRCRLHIRPGKHQVVFFGEVTSRDRITLDFTAMPGKSYGLDRSACAGSFDGHGQTCRVEIVEVDLASGS